ncbi:hypothetical protein J6E39_02170 [bacterium]|nr:hypothetical protein [bacterium]
MIENNVQIRNSNINFAGKSQLKKHLVSKVQKYYENVEDYANTILYKSMDNRAKARMHLKKSLDLQNQILDFSEKNSEEVFNKKETLKAYAKMAKLSASAIYENILWMFYSIKK